MSDQKTETETVTITVDGRAIEAKKGDMVIAAAERAGVYIPRFCWHPRMKAVGMCRMCVVEISSPKGMMLQPSCYVPVADGQEVVTTSEKVKKVQDGVLEFLLINHPLDCPVCDRGGECPLQDQTIAFGPGESRFVEEKRHWAKPIPINPLVALDRERCIQCARCTRFAEEVAGDPLIDFVGRTDLVEVNTFPGKPFDSNFSVNIVQICPVGALTSTPYRFRARPWDLDVVESTCTACAVGCRIAVQSSSNRIVRHLGIDSDAVNHGWLCDKGRFYYEAVDNDDTRLRHPLVRRGDQLVEVSWGEAMQAAADGLRRARDTAGGPSIAVLGGARLPNEDAYAWAKFARAVLGTDSVDCQMGDGLPAETVLGLPRASIDEACLAPAVLLLGPDLKEELPILYLRLRAAAVDGTTKLVELSPQPTGLTRYAEASLMYRPGEAATAVRSLLERPESDPRLSQAAEVLGRDEGIVVVLGRPSLAESADGIVQAAGILAETLPGVRFLSALRRGNVHGALDMGLAPGVLPGRVSLEEAHAWYLDAWGALPEERGLDAAGILAAADQNRIEALILLGADPLSDFPDRALARRGLAGARFTVVVDTLPNPSHEHADVILPAAMFGERPGTTTNIEGRVTRLNQKVTAPGTARHDWMVAAELAVRLGNDLGFDSLDGIAAEIERVAPSHAGVTPHLLAQPGYRDGVVVPLSDREPAPVPVSEGPPRAFEQIEVAATRGHLGAIVHETEPAGAGAPLEPVPSEPPVAVAEPERPPLLRFSPPAETRSVPPVDAYSLRLVSGRRLYDAGVMVEHSPALRQLIPGSSLRANPHDLDQVGIRPGEPVRVTSSRGSLVIEATADAGMPRGSASMVFNQPDHVVAELFDSNQAVTEVRIESVGARS